MLKTKPVRIDDRLAATPPGATLADILPFDIHSVTTPQGALITRDQFARVPVPAGFDTNLSAINKGDGAEAQHDRAPARMPRLRAADIAIEQFFATNPVWRWFVIGAKLSGLIMITACVIASGCCAGQVLLSSDAALRSDFTSAVDDSGLLEMRVSFLAIVVFETAVTMYLLGAIRRLWRKTFGIIPFVQRVIAMAKFTLELFGTILLATLGGFLVVGFIPAVLRGGEPSEFAAFAVGIVFLGCAVHTIVQWARVQARHP